VGRDGFGRIQMVSVVMGRTGTQSPFLCGKGFSLVVSLFLLAGCAVLDRSGSSPVKEEAGAIFFHGTELYEGDVILTRGTAPVSALLARGIAAVPGPYSHSGIFFRDEQGVPQLMNIQQNGMVIAPLARTLPYYARVAVFRHQSVSAASRRLGEAARRWQAENRASRVQQALSLRKIAEQQNSFSCVTLINKIYEESDLDPPFVIDEPKVINRWIEWINSRSGWSLEKMPTANSLLTHPHFQQVVAWEHPDAPQNLIQVYDIVADQSCRYLHAGERPRRPRMAERIRVGTLQTCGVVDEKTAFLMEVKAMFTKYAMKVYKGWLFLEQRHPREDETLEQRVRKLCDVYKERYFEPFDGVSLPDTP